MFHRAPDHSVDGQHVECFTIEAFAHVTVDRGDGATYRVGDPIDVCYELSQPFYINLVDLPPSGPSVILLQGYDDGAGDCFNGTITFPTGQECFRILAGEGPGGALLASDETCIRVVRPPVSVDVSVNKGNGATYLVGEPIRVCITLNQPLYINLIDEPASGPPIVMLQGFDDGTGGCLDGVIERPLGEECFRLLAGDGPGQPVLDEDVACINVAAPQEVCDGIDNDLDGQIDEGFTNSDGDAQADCVDPDDDNDTIQDGPDQCDLNGPQPTSREDIDEFEDANGCADPDNDEDGICDPGQTAPDCTGSDSCRNLAEDRDGIRDTDGCPDPDDPDGDGVPEPFDECPNEDEDRDGFQDDDGCPDPDNDGDGIGDPSDRCPNLVESPNGVGDSNGCPEHIDSTQGNCGPSDPDCDGVPGTPGVGPDRCPFHPENANGHQSGDGCPDTLALTNPPPGGTQHPDLVDPRTITINGRTPPIKIVNGKPLIDEKCTRLGCDEHFVMPMRCPDGSMPFMVRLLLMLGNDVVESTFMTPQGSNWTGMIRVPPNPPGTLYTLHVVADCPTGIFSQYIGDKELIDPSGFITNACTGEPVRGAKVTLQRLVGSTWVIADPSEQRPGGGSIMDPALNPLFTDEDGHYAWDVVAGTWRVVVEASGYVTQTSREVVIPPPVTDLDLQLEPVVGCPQGEETLTICPEAGKWAISVWTGGDDTPTEDVLATCTGIALAWCIHPSDQVWSGYFVGAPPILNTLLSVDSFQALLLLGGDDAVGAVNAGVAPQTGELTVCPEPQKWALTAWDGDDNTETGDALATCSGVALAWSIGPSDQVWSGYFVGAPPILNTLLEVDNLLGMLVRGGE